MPQKIDITGGEMSNALDKDELLEEFESAFGRFPYAVKTELGFEGEIWRRHQKNERAYNQIVALIKSGNE